MKAIFSALLFCFLCGVSAFAQEAAQIFDSFEDVPCDDYLGRMDNGLITARANPSSRLYILIYEGKVRYNRNESRLPVFGSVEAKIRSIKKYLSIKKFPVRDVTFVKAGFREYASLEFWLAPPGAAPPKPTPTLTKMKYRKGKPAGFCTDCCGP